MFKPDEWCERRVVPSPRHSGWWGFVISNGNVKDELDLSFSSQLSKKCAVEEIGGRVLTVLWIRDGLLQGWKRAGGARGLRRCLERVFSEKDGRRFFKEVWERADVTEEIRTKTAKRQKAIHDRRAERDDVRDVFMSGSTVRGAASHYRDF